MAVEKTSQDQRVPEPPRRRFGSRRVRPPALSREGWLLLESSGWYIRLVDILDHPTTALLASEDNDFLIRMGVSRKLLTDVMYKQKAVADGEGDKSTRRCLTRAEDVKYNVATAQ